MLIFEDSIKESIYPSAIANCYKIQAVNYLTGGSKVQSIYKQPQAFKKDHGNASLKSMIMHFGINHLLRGNLMDVANKIFSLMVHARKECPTSFYFSPILHKFSKLFNSMINYVNNKLFNLCLANQKMEFIQHNNFSINHYLNYDFFWKTKCIQVTPLCDN